MRDVLAANGQGDAKIQRIENKAKGASKFQISTENLAAARGQRDHRLR